MSNKKIYVLILSLLFAGLVFQPVEAKKSVGSDGSTDTAGVTGLEYAKYANDCKSRTCIKLIRKIKDLKKNVDGLKEEKAQNNEELKVLEARMSSFDKLFVDLAKGKVSEQEAKELMQSPLPQEQEKNPDCSEENKTQVDVEPTPQAYLKHGDLIAWGIPRIPSIPRAKSNSSSSSSSSSSSQAKQVNDESYKAVRSMEQNSEKVTDSEVDQFLNELSSRATASK